MRRNVNSFVMTAVIALGAFGCVDDVEHQSIAESLSEREPAEESVVARVDGRPVTREEIAHFRKIEGVDDDAARERIIERELLVGEALERGYGELDTLDVERKRGMVKAFLRREIDEKITPETVSGEELEKAVEEVTEKRTRPAGFRTSQILVMVSTGRGKNKFGEEKRDELFEEAREWSSRIRGALSEEPDIQELMRVARRFKAEIPKTMRVRAELHLKTPVADYEGPLPKGWIRVVPDYAKTAARLAREGNVVSEPVRSRFGWHVVRLEREYERRVPSRDEVDAEARKLAATRLRKTRLDELTETSGESYALFPEVIRELSEPEK